MKGIPPSHKRSKIQSKMIHPAGPTLRTPAALRSVVTYVSVGQSPFFNWRLTLIPHRGRDSRLARFWPIRSRDKKITFTFWRLPCKILKINPREQNPFSRGLNQSKITIVPKTGRGQTLTFLANELSSQQEISMTLIYVFFIK